MPKYRPGSGAALIVAAQAIISFDALKRIRQRPLRLLIIAVSAILLRNGGF